MTRLPLSDGALEGAKRMQCLMNENKQSVPEEEKQNVGRAHRMRHELEENARTKEFCEETKWKLNEVSHDLGCESERGKIERKPSDDNHNCRIGNNTVEGR